MAKGVISKKKKAPSVHSRAARRATSPSINTDKSLKNVQPPPESVDHRPSVLSIHHGAGVTKKQKKGRTLSTRARKRHEKAQDRAAIIMERTEKKVTLSKDQSRTIQSRRKVWDAVNQEIPLIKAQAMGKVHRDEDDTDELELDDDMGEVVDEGDAAKAESKPAPETTMDQDDEDGIL
ncbi:hypothetical protein HD806DRAFT_107451 [Xylariaceae sp. AK1471]|nr:hypothetical protein HD806DRAFT_107451 [Xylariaceae sp. AK1471]